MIANQAHLWCSILGWPILLLRHLSHRLQTYRTCQRFGMLWHWMHTILHAELQTHWNFFSLLLGNIFRRRFVLHGNVHPRWYPSLPTLVWLGYRGHENNRLFRNEENVLRKKKCIILTLDRLVLFIERGQVLICFSSSVQTFSSALTKCAFLVMCSFWPLSLFADFISFILGLSARALYWNCKKGAEQTKEVKQLKDLGMDKKVKYLQDDGSWDELKECVYNANSLRYLRKN